MNNTKNQNYLLAAIVVIISLVLSWLLLISPPRSEKAKLQNQLVENNNTLGNTERPILEANRATKLAVDNSLRSLKQQQLNKLIRQNATKNNLAAFNLAPIGNDYRLSFTGSLNNISAFLDDITSGAEALRDGQLIGISPFIVIDGLNIELQRKARYKGTVNIKN